MKIICTQENLKNGLSHVSRIISSSQTLPVLSTVLLKTEQGQLKISATNLEIGISTVIRCKIEEEGSICVPAKPLIDVVNTLQNKNITLQLEATELKVTCEGTALKIKTLSPEEFPIIPSIENGEKLEISAKTLKTTLDQVAFAAQSNSSQPEISGVFLSLENQTLKLVATDRYRLAETQIDLKSPHGSIQIILPQKTAGEISRILSDATQVVEMFITSNQISLTYKDIQLVSRLIEGSFPPYESIIPKNFNTTLQVKRCDLLSALKTISIFSQSSSGIKFQFLQEENKLRTSAMSETFGEGSSELEALVLGESGQVVFNYHYILDVLNTITEELVNIKIIDPAHPVIITPENNTGYLYLVMPITL